MAETKTIVRTDHAPRPIGPYSQATRLGNLVFTAGVGGIDLSTGKMVEGGVQAQTRQTLDNLRAILEAAGTSLDHALKTTCYLTDIADFAAFNDVYKTYFSSNPPARTTIQAAKLPGGISVEIDVIAYVP